MLWLCVHVQSCRIRLHQRRTDWTGRPGHDLWPSCGRTDPIIQKERESTTERWVCCLRTALCACSSRHINGYVSLFQTSVFISFLSLECNRCLTLPVLSCTTSCLCVCVQSEGGESEPAVVLPGGQKRTKPLIPERCFTTTTEDSADIQPSTPHLEEDGTSLLISCSLCSVRVHTSEYWPVTILDSSPFYTVPFKSLESLRFF